MSDVSGPNDQQQRMQVANKRLRGCLLIAGAICLLIPLFAAIRYGWDAAVDAPWAYTLWHKQTLTGTWLGTFSLPTGLDFALYLDVRHDVLALGKLTLKGATGGAISGEASWCDSDGRQALHLPIQGGVPLFAGYNDSADGLEIIIHSTVQPDIGLLPDIYAGKRQAGTLLLQPSFSSNTGRAFAYSRDNLDLKAPILITFHKADEVAFRAACISIGAGPIEAPASVSRHS